MRSWLSSTRDHGAMESTINQPTRPLSRRDCMPSLEVDYIHPANYQYAESWTTRNMNDTRTLEQVYKEEDEEYDL